MIKTTTMVALLLLFAENAAALSAGNTSRVTPYKPFKTYQVDGYCNGAQSDGPRESTIEECWNYCGQHEHKPYAEWNPNAVSYGDIGTGCWCHSSCSAIRVYNDFSPKRWKGLVLGDCFMSLPPPESGNRPSPWPYSSTACGAWAPPPPAPFFTRTCVGTVTAIRPTLARQRQRSATRTALRVSALRSPSLTPCARTVRQSAGVTRRAPTSRSMDATTPTAATSHRTLSWGRAIWSYRRHRAARRRRRGPTPRASRATAAPYSQVGRHHRRRRRPRGTECPLSG